jgi:hypothetical protein
MAGAVKPPKYSTFVVPLSSDSVCGRFSRHPPGKFFCERRDGTRYAEFSRQPVCRRQVSIGSSVSRARRFADPNHVTVEVQLTGYFGD